MANIFKSNEKTSVEYQKQLRFPNGELGRQVGEQMFDGNASSIDDVIAKMDLKDGLKICDIGCGPGYSLLQLSKKIISGKIIGIDPSEEMCKQARENNQHAIASGLVDIYQEATPDLHFKNDYFDYILVNNVIYFWKDLKTNLKEIQRIISKSGELIIFMRTKESLQERISEEDGVFNMYSDHDVMDVLTDIGFKNIKSEKVKQVVHGSERYGFIITAERF